MSAHINYKNIYKEAYNIFRRVKLLRIIGAVISTAFWLHFAITYCILILSTYVTDAGDIVADGMLGINGISSIVSPRIQFIYILTLISLGIFYYIFYLFLRNWAIGSLIGGINLYYTNKNVSLSTASDIGKSKILKLIPLDFLLMLILAIILMMMSYIKSIIPVRDNIMQDNIKIFFIILYIFIAGFTLLIHHLASRFVVLNNYHYKKAFISAINMIKSNFVSLVTILIINQSMLIGAILLAILVFTAIMIFSALLSYVSGLASLFIYNLDYALAGVALLFIPIFFGIYNVFSFAVWNLVFLKLVRSKN